MKGFIEFITDPAWLGVIITAINTIAVAVIAVVQIRMQRQQTLLQKRQTEAADYEVYKALYPLVYSANQRIDSFLNDMWTAFWAQIYRFEKDFLENRVKEIDHLINELNKNRIDYELKFSKEFFDYNGYIEILSLMSRISHFINDAIKNNEVQLNQSAVHRGNNNYILDIARYIKDPQSQGLLIVHLEKFIQKKENLRAGDDLLIEIKKRCKIN
jgi:hypothetical protein